MHHMKQGRDLFWIKPEEKNKTIVFEWACNPSPTHQDTAASELWRTPENVSAPASKPSGTLRMDLANLAIPGPQGQGLQDIQISEKSRHPTQPRIKSEREAATTQYLERCSTWAKQIHYTAILCYPLLQYALLHWPAPNLFWTRRSIAPNKFGFRSWIPTLKIFEAQCAKGQAETVYWMT